MTDSLFDLTGRVAVVTGGMGQLGAAYAAGLAGRGMKVAVFDIETQPSDGIASLPDAVRSFEVDVTDRASIEQATEEVEALWGVPHLLVNNAGIDRFAYFVNSDEQLWDVVLGVNLRGVLACTHAVLRTMQERGGGVIVNVASEAGRVGSQGSATYAAAKAGVIGSTKSIARESARFGVRCNAVAPGPIETPLLNSAPEQLGELGARLKQAMIDATTMRRIGEPEEVASVIAFLASDDASYVTGQTINVSGGLSMW